MAPVRTPYLFCFTLAMAFFGLHISGDYVFYKTNTLNLALLWAFSFILAITMPLNSFDNKVQLIVFLLVSILPVILTIPGLIFNGIEFSYFSLHEYSVRIVAILFGFFSIIFLSVSNYKERAVYVLALIGFFLCVIGILQWLGLEPLVRLRLNFFESEWLHDSIGYSGLQDRVSSTAGNPNYFAAVIISITPILLAFLMISHKSISNWSTYFLASTIFMLVLNLVLTGSRGGLIAFVAAILVYYLIYSRIRRLNPFPVFILSLVILFFALLAVPSTFERVLNIGTDSASLTRIVIWKAALNSILEGPLLGYGMGSSYALFFTFSDAEPNIQFIRSFLHPHNSVLESLQEGGVVLVCFYLGFYYWLGRCCYRFVSDENISVNDRLLLSGCVAGLVALFIQGLFSVAPRMVIALTIQYSLLAYIIYSLVRHDWIRAHFLASISKNLRLSTLKIPVVFILALVGFWLVPYLSAQYSNASSLSDYYRNPTKTLLAADELDDVYLLDRAINAAIYLGEYDRVYEYVARQESLIRDYRLTRHQHAYALYKDRVTDEAIAVALQAQESNPYYLQTVHLLIHESFKNNDYELFKRQFEIMLRKLICRHNGRYCNEKRVLFATDRPFGFLESEGSLIVTFDHLFFSQLTEIRNYSTSRANGYSEIRRLLSRNEFFTPQQVLSFSPDQLSRLKEYVRLDELQSKVEKNIKELSIVSDSHVYKDIQLYNDEKNNLNDQLFGIHLSKDEIAQELGSDFDIQVYTKRHFLNSSIAKNMINFLYFE